MQKYKYTELGWIPEDWCIDYLDNLSKRGTGHTPDKTKQEYYNGGIPWISLSDSYRLDQLFIYKTEKEISIDGLNNSSAALHPKGTVVLSRDAGVGKSAIMSKEMAVSQHFVTWTCSKKLDSLFLYYVLQFRKSEFERIAVGSTIKTIGMPYFSKLKIAAPILREQKQIAERLILWDKSIQTLTQLIFAKQRLKKQLMLHLLFNHKKTIENKWYKTTIFECCEILDNKRKPLNEGERRNIKGNIPYYGANGVVDFIDKYIFEEDLILIAEDGGHFMEYDKRPIAYKISGKSWVNNHAHVLKAKKNYSQTLIFYSLEHKDISKYLNGGTRAKLNRSELEKIEVMLPSNSNEQEKIAQTFIAIDKEIALLKCQFECYLKQKKGLMQQLLTGKKRIKI